MSSICIQRFKANKKERRRTQSINQAFQELRRHIPSVPSDTKLSKIKTLRLAISYINHLVSILKSGDQQQQRAQLASVASGDTGASGGGTCANYSTAAINVKSVTVYRSPATRYMSAAQDEPAAAANATKKHRTGWPEIVWKTEPATPGIC